MIPFTTMSCRVGNGIKTRLMKDHCLEGNLVMERYFTLYQIVVHKNCFIADRKQDNHWLWNWIMPITTPLENVQFLELWSILDHFTFSNDIDGWTWDLDDVGLFTVKYTRKYNEDLMLHSKDEPTFWNKFVPKKVNIFS
mgnify:CR=1 FL=1